MNSKDIERIGLMVWVISLLKMGEKLIRRAIKICLSL
jgi:hypothetical protein